MRINSPIVPIDEIIDVIAFFWKQWTCKHPNITCYYEENTGLPCLLTDCEEYCSLCHKTIKKGW